MSKNWKLKLAVMCSQISWHVRHFIYANEYIRQRRNTVNVHLTRKSIVWRGYIRARWFDSSLARLSLWRSVNENLMEALSTEIIITFYL